mmetsp:Transcript_35083/g.56754  ORF Transcript_35083/g.56754 Transcript_35083/m.56754 type:complete len:167 (+) Transcript_35083:583-1083(+)
MERIKDTNCWFGTVDLPQYSTGIRYKYCLVCVKSGRSFLGIGPSYEKLQEDPEYGDDRICRGDTPVIFDLSFKGSDQQPSSVCFLEHISALCLQVSDSASSTSLKESLLMYDSLMRQHPHVKEEELDAWFHSSVPSAPASTASSSAMDVSNNNSNSTFHSLETLRI